MKFTVRGASARQLLLASVVVFGLALALVVAMPAPASAPAAATAPGDRNLVRARATLATIERNFQTDGDRFLEVYPSSADAYTTLWPLTQLQVGELLLGALPGEQAPAAGLAAFEPYWDALVSPPGYAASSGSHDRKFFDDNAWTGLALVQEYRLTGERAALERARQVFNFTASGWDSDPTHADPGGVWWSQQMPNPRFIHRNTISTAASAVLALRLYEATGRTEPDYLDWASRMYSWVDAYLRGDNGLYGDHVDLAGLVDPGQLAYNQGMMIETSLLLYDVSHAPSYLAHATSIADPSLEIFGPEFNQQPVYNAVFFRALRLLEAQTGDDRYRTALQTYADQVWDTMRDPSSGLFNVAYGRNRSIEPHRLIDQAAMLQIYAVLALGSSAPDFIT